MENIKLKIKHFKIPIKREGDEIIEEQIALTDEHLVKTEDIEIESMFKLQEVAQKVGQYNQRQLGYAKTDNSRDYILKKIIVK